MLRGSCLCNRVNYEIKGEPQSMYYCHCSMCRKTTGSAFATNMLIAADDFILISGKDSITGYESSPNEYRYFCSNCGSPLYGQAQVREGLVSIRCGTLNEDPGIRPSAHYFSRSKASWDKIADHLPRVPEESNAG